MSSILLGVLALCACGGTVPRDEPATSLSQSQALAEDNGLVTNGLTFNGLVTNGLTNNGLVTNGLDPVRAGHQ